MSEIVGVVLLFTLVIMGAVVITLSGFSAWQSAEQKSQFSSAQTAMQELRSEVSSLQYENQSAEVSFDLEGASGNVRVVDDGRIAFSLNDRASCTATRPLGTVLYENDEGDTVAYQANGVWKSVDSSDGSAMLAPPDIDYGRERVDGVPVWTLDYPLTTVDVGRSGANGTDTVVASPTGEDGRQSMARDLCLAGSDDETVDHVSNVTVRVEGSTYYQAWARFLRSEFGDRPARYEVREDTRTVVVHDVPLGRAGGGGAEGDADGDGYGDSFDRCPNDPGGGAAGCTGLRPHPDANGLLVNQTGASARVLGTVVADEATTIAGVGGGDGSGERDPLNVVFVIDSTESMESRSETRCVSTAPDCRDPGTYTVPEGEIWTTDGSSYRPGEEVDLDTDDEADEDGDGDPSDDGQFTVTSIGTDPNGRRYDAVQRFVSVLEASAGDRAGYLQYDTNVTVITTLSEDLQETEREASGSGGNREGDVDRSYDPGGDSAVVASLQRGIEMLDNNGRDNRELLVFLTDGDLSNGGGGPRRAAQEAQRKGISIYTVAMGDDAARGLLTSISSITGGQNYVVNDSGRVVSVFSDMAAAATQQGTARIDYPRVSAGVEVDGRVYPIADDLNEPGSSGTPTRYVDFARGSTVSFVSTFYRCDSGRDAGTLSHDGTVYDQHECLTDDTALRRIDNGSDLHRVFVDGDPVPADLTGSDLPWYKPGIESVVTGHDPSLVEGGRFNLSPNQAIAVLELDAGDDYTVVLFEADRELPEGSSVDPVGPNNDYVINVGYRAIEVDEADEG